MQHQQVYSSAYDLLILKILFEYTYHLREDSLSCLFNTLYCFKHKFIIYDYFK